MSREELIEKMCEAFARIGGNQMVSKEYQCRCMAAALDVAVGELLKSPSQGEMADVQFSVYARYLLESRRARYLKPKSDPAVEAVKRILERRDCVPEHCAEQYIEGRAIGIVAAVRNADKGAN